MSIIPPAPPVRIEEKRCKVVFHNNEKFCILAKPVKSQDGSYFLPVLNIPIDRISAKVFNKSGYKAFQAVPRDNIYILRPIGKSAEPEEKYEYEEEKKGGQGAYGLVTLYPTRKLAQKSFSSTKMLLSDTVKEIAIYKLHSHIDCLPKMYAFDVEGEKKVIDIDMGVNTLTIIKNYSPEIKKNILFRLIKCLWSIASRGIIHCDIKPQNIILMENGKLQIIDWGLAEIDYSKNQTRPKHSHKQTVTYAAPEIIFNNKYNYHEPMPYTYKIDVFSLGIIMSGIFLNVSLGDKYLTAVEYINKLFGEVYGIERQISDREHKLVLGYYTGAISEEDVQMFDGNFFSKYPVNIAETAVKHLRKFTNDPLLAVLIFMMLHPNPTLRLDYKRIILNKFFEHVNRERVRNISEYTQQKMYYGKSMPEIKNIDKIWREKGIQKSRGVVLEFMRSKCEKEELNIFCSAVQILDLFIYKNVENIRHNIDTCAITALYLGVYLFSTLDSELTRFVSSELNRNAPSLPNVLITVVKGDLLMPTFSAIDEHLYGYLPIRSVQHAEKLQEYFSLYSNPEVYTQKFSRVTQEEEIDRVRSSLRHVK